jgi:hypothetical protein
LQGQQLGAAAAVVQSQLIQLVCAILSWCFCIINQSAAAVVVHHSAKLHMRVCLSCMLQPLLPQ